MLLSYYEDECTGSSQLKATEQADQCVVALACLGGDFASITCQLGDVTSHLNLVSLSFLICDAS